MNPWAPQPLSLLHDLRVRGLSWAERGVLHHLHLVAATSSADGLTVAVTRRAGEAATAAWTRALGAEGATAVGRLIEAGLVVECNEGLRLTLAPGGRGAPPVGSQGAPTSERSSEAFERSEGAAALAPKVVSARARKLKWAFENRVGELADIAPGVTWETWRESAEGRAAYARRVLGFGHTERERNAAGTFLRSSGTRSGNATGTPAERHGNGQRNAPLTSSETSSFVEKEREETGTERQRNGTERNASGTRQRNALDDLRDAAAGRATLIDATSIELELSRVIERHGLTPEELTRAGEAFGDVAAWWPKGKHAPPSHVTINDLAGFRTEGGYEWRALGALVGFVRAPSESKRRPAGVARPAIDPAALAAAEAQRNEKFREAPRARAAKKEAVY